MAGVLVPQIQLKVVDLGERLVPVIEGLEVDGTDPSVPLPEQVRDEVASDEAAAAGHQDQIILASHRSASVSRVIHDAGRQIGATKGLLREGLRNAPIP